MEKTNLKQLNAVVVIIIGAVLVCVGFTTKIPGTQLTTYSILEGTDDYSVIKEYINGDAYNYIIGASLIGGQIAGATALKGIYIGFGLLIMSIGLIFGACVFNPWNKESVQVKTADEVPAIEQTAVEQHTAAGEEPPVLTGAGNDNLNVTE